MNEMAINKIDEELTILDTKYNSISADKDAYVADVISAIDNRINIREITTPMKNKLIEQKFTILANPTKFVDKVLEDLDNIKKKKLIKKYNLENE